MLSIEDVLQRSTYIFNFCTGSTIDESFLDKFISTVKLILKTSFVYFSQKQYFIKYVHTYKYFVFLLKCTRCYVGFV